MAAVRNGVAELHDLYTRLRTVQNQLQSAPRQIKIRQQVTAAKQAEIEALKEKMKKLRILIDQNNLQVKSNEMKILTLKVKLNQASSNKEFDALRSQVEADEMANSVQEDDVLAGMEKVDRLKVEQTELEAELVTLQAAEAKLIKDLAAVEPGLKAQIAEFEGQIKAAESIIPGEIESAYRRMVQQQGPEAFTEVEGNQCQNCFVTLPPQTLVELRSGRVMFCKSCSKVMHIIRRSSRE